MEATASGCFVLFVERGAQADPSEVWQLFIVNVACDHASHSGVRDECEGALVAIPDDHQMVPLSIVDGHVVQVGDVDVRGQVWEQRYHDARVVCHD
uniref:Putative secreted protein n=1 Tax=Ixodes ricinus TaxID=34613 RepID=A0A6B0UHV0_IXORI